MHDVSSSHIYFTKRERAVWRNLTSWTTEHQIEFLDLASWWDDDYDFESHEWLHDEDAKDAEEVIILVKSEYDDVSSAFSRWYSFENILTLLSSSVKNLKWWSIFILNRIYLSSSHLIYFSDSWLTLWFAIFDHDSSQALHQLHILRSQDNSFCMNDA